MKQDSTRRQFIKSTAMLAGAAGIAAPNFSFNLITKKAQDSKIVGHGDHTYKVDKAWGNQDPGKIPVKDCHEMVQDQSGRLILLTNETRNNVVIYDKSGKVLDTWGADFPGAMVDAY